MAKLTDALRALQAKKLSIEKAVPFQIAVRDTISMMGIRIFENGLNQSGSRIGAYSTTPIYVSPNQAPKAVNKTGKTGKTIKSGYYAKGYFEFRGQQGREQNFVNLRLTNEFQNDYLNVNLSEGSKDVGKVKSATPFKVTTVVYAIKLKKQINQDKRRGIESKYGPVFTASNLERQNFTKVLDFETRRILNA